MNGAYIAAPVVACTIGNCCFSVTVTGYRKENAVSVVCREAHAFHAVDSSPLLDGFFHQLRYLGMGRHLALHGGISIQIQVINEIIHASCYIGSSIVFQLGRGHHGRLVTITEERSGFRFTVSPDVVRGPHHAESQIHILHLLREGCHRFGFTIEIPVSYPGKCRIIVGRSRQQTAHLAQFAGDTGSDIVGRQRDLHSRVK